MLYQLSYQAIWLSTASFLRAPFLEKVLDINTNLNLLGKWPRISPAVRRALFACFSLFFVNCRLATFHRKVKNRRYRVFQVFCTNARMLRGDKAILFIFISHSLLTFGSWGNLKVLTLDFERFSSEVHCELETKTVSNFPHFMSSPTVTSRVLFPTIIRQFSRPLYDYER